MTDIFRASFIVLLLTIGLSAYLLVIGALFSNRVAKAQKSLTSTPDAPSGLEWSTFSSSA